jgi:hypothetical protein
MQELLPPLAMYVSVADLACRPPEGTSTQSGGLLRPPEEWSFEHPAIPAKAVRRISDRVVCRRSRKERMGTVMAPPVQPVWRLHLMSFRFPPASAPATENILYAQWETETHV